MYNKEIFTIFFSIFSCSSMKLLVRSSFYNKKKPNKQATNKKSIFFLYSIQSRYFRDSTNKTRQLKQELPNNIDTKCIKQTRESIERYLRSQVEKIHDKSGKTVSIMLTKIEITRMSVKHNHNLPLLCPFSLHPLSHYLFVQCSIIKQPNRNDNLRQLPSGAFWNTSVLQQTGYIQQKFIKHLEFK